MLGLHYSAIVAWAAEEGYPLRIVNRDRFLWEGEVRIGPAILMPSVAIQIAFRMRFF